MKIFKLLLLVAISFAFNFQLNSQIEPDWTWSDYTSMGSLNGHSYYHSTNNDIKAFWAGAQVAAATQGGYLVSITSAEENAFLVASTNMPIAPLIGLSDFAGVFVWESGEPFDYTSWIPGEPSGGIPTQNEFVHMQLSGSLAGGWNDLGNFWGPFHYIVEIVDADADGVPDANDNCPNTANPDQVDSDGDGIGDVCDNCVATPNADQTDSDGDGIGDVCDNCVATPNADQIDSDGDGIGDVCDNCVAAANADQTDSDGDGIGDVCDNCVAAANADQTDSDGDGIGDVCDNCVATPNADQIDSDGDGIGDVCDACPAIPDPNCDTCGNGKYLVCHIPAGNNSNPQQLCVSYNAAINHVGNHGGCFWGDCNGSSSISANDTDTPQLQRHIFEGEVEYASHFFEVTPNPASHEVKIHLHGHQQNAKLMIYNQFGQRLMERTVDASDSHFSIILDDARFVNGIYFINVYSNGETWTKRIVVAK